MLRRLREIDPALPPDVAGSMPGEARILDYGEHDMVRPSGKPVRRRAVSPELKRYLVLVTACLLTAATVWAWNQPRTTATTPAASPEAATAAAPSEVAVAATPAPASPSPTDSPTPTATPAVSPSPRDALAGVYVTTGWVRRVDLPLGAGPEVGPVGPDGRIYVADSVLEADGTFVRTSPWSVPQVFDQDRNAYGVQNDADSATIWAVEPDGSPIFTYSITTQAHIDLFHANSSLYAVYTVSDGVPTTHVLVLDRSGTPLNDLSIPFPIRTLQGKPQMAIRPDGRILAEVDRTDGCAIETYAPDGQLLFKAASCWDAFRAAADGTLLGWSCLALLENGGCEQTSAAVLDEDGRPARGWPKLFKGRTSMPSAGPRGIFLVALRDDTGASEILGFGRSGEPLKGWPVATDRPPRILQLEECACQVLAPVVVGERSGIVLLQTEFDTTAWSEAGKLMATWGVEGTPMGTPIVDDSGPSPILFMASDERVQAFRPQGIDTQGVVSGFVDRGANKVAWVGWQRTPAGGIVVFVFHSSEREAYVVVAHLDVSA